MNAPKFLLALAAGLVLVVSPGCAKKVAEPPKVKPVQPQASAPPKPTKDWTGLLTKLKATVDYKAKQAEILAKLEQGEKIRADAANLDQAAQKAEYKKAFNLYTEAGDYFDVLKSDVDKVDKELWDHEFGDFQRKFDRLAQKLKRLAYK